MFKLCTKNVSTTFKSNFIKRIIFKKLELMKKLNKEKDNISQDENAEP